MQEIGSTKYLSRRVAGLKPSGIRKFFDIAATMKDVISLGIGEPDFTTPKPILEAGIRSLQAGETHYTSNSGKLELRQAIADNLQRLYGVQYDPVNEIIATVGVSEALYLTMTALLDPGDEVIIPTPCFVSYQAEVYPGGRCAGGDPQQHGGQLPGGPGRHPRRHHPAHQGHLCRLSQQPHRRGGRARNAAGDCEDRRGTRPDGRLG